MMQITKMLRLDCIAFNYFRHICLNIEMLAIFGNELFKLSKQFTMHHVKEWSLCVAKDFRESTATDIICTDNRFLNDFVAITLFG